MSDAPTLKELKYALSVAHTEVLAAKEDRRLCADALNKADAKLAQACRYRYEADTALQERLLAISKEHPDFEI